MKTNYDIIVNHSSFFGSVIGSQPEMHSSCQIPNLRHPFPPQPLSDAAELLLREGIYDFLPHLTWGIWGNQMPQHSQMQNATHTHLRRMQCKGWIRDFEIVWRVKERLSVRRKRERVTSRRSRGDEARCPIREKVKRCKLSKTVLYKIAFVQNSITTVFE